MLRALEHPAVRAAQVAQHLELTAQERVVRVLVQAEVVVAPRRHPREPLQRVRAQVEIHQLALLLDRGRRPVVHQRGERRRPLGHLVLAQVPEVPRVDAVATRAVAEHRDRLLHLPPRHRPEPPIGGQQVHQVRGARSWQAHHDHRRLELDLERLGMAAHEVLEPQARREQPDQSLAHQVAAETRQPVVGLDRGDLRGQTIEQGRVTEVVQPVRRSAAATNSCGSRSTSMVSAISWICCSSALRCGSRRSAIRMSSIRPPGSCRDADGGSAWTLPSRAATASVRSCLRHQGPVPWRLEARTAHSGEVGAARAAAMEDQP